MDSRWSIRGSALGGDGWVISVVAMRHGVVLVVVAFAISIGSLQVASQPLLVVIGDVGAHHARILYDALDR